MIRLEAIGNKRFESETDSISHFISDDRKQVFWDLPGFKDSNGMIKRIHHAIKIREFSKIANFSRSARAIQIAMGVPPNLSVLSSNMQSDSSGVPWGWPYIKIANF